jgi:hypothetical protein
MIDVNEMLKAAEEAYDEKITQLRQAIREQLLIPFCKRYEMAFDSGMGTWTLENELIMIWSSGDWELGKRAKKACGDDDDAHEALTLKAREFVAQPETQELVKALDSLTIWKSTLGCHIAPFVGGSMANQKSKCACEGTGLIPPTDKLPKGGRQAYCPTHKAVRTWPQLQEDGSVQYKELRSDNRGLK